MRTLLAAAFAVSMLAGISMTGCETSRTDTHKEHLLGGSTDTTTVTKKNPVTGDTSTETTKTDTK